MTTFHSDEYIDLIKSVTPENRKDYEDQLYRFNFKEDCPVMERLYDYCVSYTTGSICIFALMQHARLCWRRANTPMGLIGVEGCTMLNNLRLLDFAILTTVCWLFYNC